MIVNPDEKKLTMPFLRSVIPVVIEEALTESGGGHALLYARDVRATIESWYPELPYDWRRRYRMICLVMLELGSREDIEPGSPSSEQGPGFGMNFYTKGKGGLLLQTESSERLNQIRLTDVRAFMNEFPELGDFDDVQRYGRGCRLQCCRNRNPWVKVRVGRFLHLVLNAGLLAEFEGCLQQAGNRTIRESYLKVYRFHLFCNGEEGSPVVTENYGREVDFSRRFEKEADLERVIIDQWENIPHLDGYEFYESQKWAARDSRLDILAKATDGSGWLVIELKKGVASIDALGQLSRYMGHVCETKKLPGQMVRGAIVAAACDKQLEIALKVHANIDFIRYTDF